MSGSVIECACTALIEVAGSNDRILVIRRKEIFIDGTTHTDYVLGTISGEPAFNSHTIALMSAIEAARGIEQLRKESKECQKDLFRIN